MIRSNGTFFSMELAQRLGELALTPAALHSGARVGVPKVLRMEH